MNAVLQTLPLAELKEHPDNPRKHFDEAALVDLSESVRTHGVLTPLFVRKNGKGYEIIAGHRRFRAAQRAGLQEVSVIVRELDDTTALELMVLDNLQRSDLHPLEEAEGYASLIKAGYDVERIAAQINRSGKYVYDRIKLLQLVPEVRKVFLDGEIAAGHAILLARLSPADQLRALGADDDVFGSGNGGLFQHENVEEVLGLELDDEREPRKAVSVRELEHWINNHVRFKPEEVDLPNLFPETAAALELAAEEELKVVKIVHDDRVPDEAKDEKERTYGRTSWKRADGELDNLYSWEKAKRSTTCEHSVMGVVVAGPGRGQAFKVCVAKKKCHVHWGDEIKAAQNAKDGGGGKISPTAARPPQRDWEKERQEREAERKRWEKARPKLLEALAEKLTDTKGLELIDALVTRLKGHGQAPKQLGRGKTLEDAVRYLAFLALSAQVTDSWDPSSQVPGILKPYGINARKIVSEVSPKPKADKPAAEGKTKKKAGTGARARRRAKKAQPSTEA